MRGEYLGAVVEEMKLRLQGALVRLRQQLLQGVLDSQGDLHSTGAGSDRGDSQGVVGLEHPLPESLPAAQEVADRLYRDDLGSSAAGIFELRG